MCNIHKYDNVQLINKGFLKHKHCDSTATNANSENARSRMEASSAWKHEYGGKGRQVKHWVRLCCCISPCYGLFLLGGCFETYKPFISLIFQLFFWPQLTADNRNCRYWISGYRGKPVVGLAPVSYETLTNSRISYLCRELKNSCSTVQPIAVTILVTLSVMCCTVQL
jgi:hypothetical protein